MKKILTIAIFIILLAAPSIAMRLTNVSATPGAKLELVNPENGTNIFNFTASQKTVGDTIRIDVMVSNAPDLFTWQIAVSWDPTLLEYDSLDKTGTVFEGKTIMEGIDVSTPGLIVYGQMLLSPPGVDVTEGKLITLILKIIKGVSMLNPIVECDLTFTGIVHDTFLLNSAGTDIPIDAVVNGHYKYECSRVVHTVTVNGQSFIVITCSNGTIAPNSIVPLIEDKALQFNITGTAGKAGFVNVTIPNTLLNGNPLSWTIYVNGESVEATITWNETHTFVCFEFTFTGLDTVKIVGTRIVPEFSVAPLLLISFASSTLALSLLKVRKRKK